MPTQNSSGKIDSDKVFIKDVFKDFWFSIPEYQRSYVWEKDNINDLVDDITFAAENHPNADYFLGSMVLQKRIVKKDKIEYLEYDILDGQQRLTTLLLLFAVLRDLTENTDLKDTCKEFIYQKENKIKQIPQRLRMVYKIRENVESFFDDFISQLNGTLKLKEILKLSNDENNVTLVNMCKAIIYLNEHFSKLTQDTITTFSTYLINKVLLIYVSTEDLDDAFRLFTILNDRGIPLSNNDILKAWNLGILKDSKEQDKYAKFWENTENSFGREEFERFLSHIRTIILKEKARENILKEFDTKIFNKKPALLAKGKQALEYIEKFVGHYDKLINLNNLPASVKFDFKNLILVMKEGLPSTDWIPPLLYFYDKFKENKLFDFLKLLDNKFSSDWIEQKSPTVRIQNMNDVLKAIEKAKTSEMVINDVNIFKFDINEILKNLKGDIYSKRYSKYIMLKLELLYSDNTSQFKEFKSISVEHVLPQNPDKNSKWNKQFNVNEQLEWTNKLGNLVLLSRKKNSSLGNSDFDDKKKKYFNDNISSFPSSLRVMQEKDWTVASIAKRQKELLDKISKHYK